MASSSTAPSSGAGSGSRTALTTLFQSAVVASQYRAAFTAARAQLAASTTQLHQARARLDRDTWRLAHYIALACLLAAPPRTRPTDPVAATHTEARELLYTTTLPYLSRMADVPIRTGILNQETNISNLASVLGTTIGVAKDTIQPIIYGILLAPVPIPAGPSTPISPSAALPAEAVRLRVALHDAVVSVERGTAVIQAMGQYFNAINASLVPDIATSKGQITFFRALKHHVQRLTSGDDGGDEGGEADEGRDAGGEPEEKDFHMELRSHGAIEREYT